MEINSIIEKLSEPNLKRIDFEIGINDKVYLISAYKVIDLIRIDIKEKK